MPCCFLSIKVQSHFNEIKSVRMNLEDKPKTGFGVIE